MKHVFYFTENRALQSKMEVDYEGEKFEILDKDLEKGAKLLRLTNLPSFEKDKITMSDFKQGQAENCALIAVLTSLSGRPEFNTEIVPKTIKLRNVTKYMFKMYDQGKAIKVLIDDALPLDKMHRLIYAGSSKKSKFPISSYFLLHQFLLVPLCFFFN